MKINRLLITLCLTLTCLLTKAQTINGISVSTNSNQEKIVVVLNGQPMCEGTQSCFIANLHPGTYKIQVFPASEMDRHIASRHLLYYDKIKYDGHGVRTIQIAGNISNEEEYFRPSYIHVMNKREFMDYLKSIDDADFDSRRLERIDMLPNETSFTSEQCSMLSEVFDFDQDRVTLLKKLYPRVVDKVSFYKAIDTMDFSGNQRQVKDFVEKYNRRHK